MWTVCGDLLRAESRCFVCAERKQMKKAVIIWDLSLILKLKMLHGTIRNVFGLSFLINVLIHCHVGVSGLAQMKKKPHQVIQKSAGL